MKDCVHIDETVSMEEPRYKKKNKELHKKPKKKSMEDKELDTVRKNYKYGAENDDDEDEDFPWEDGIERIEHVSKGQKIKSTPFETGTEDERNEDQNDGKVEDEPDHDDDYETKEEEHESRSKKMPKGKRKMLVMMLAKKKMKHKSKHHDSEY